MDSVDHNDFESVSAFYTSVGDHLKGNPFMLYNIVDATGRSVSVREEISAVIYINAERRLKSLVYLDYKGQTGANFNRSLTDDLPEMEEITVGELAYAEKEQGKSIRIGDFTYLRQNKWFIVYLIRFYRQLAINIGEELPLFRLNDLESRLFNSFDEPDIQSLNQELEKIIDTIKPEFRESAEKEAIEAVSGIFRFNAPGMFVIEYAIDFLLDKLTTLGEKKIIFHKEWQYNKPVECDMALLTFIIYQVTANGIGSIKREGDIYIRTAARNNKLNIIITDTGEGIPQEIRKTLLTSSVNVSAENKGYGLYFTKMILDLMGGMIKIRSQLNRGTEVLIEIPAGKK